MTKLNGTLDIRKDLLRIKSNSSNTTYIINTLKQLQIHAIATEQSNFDILLEKFPQTAVPAEAINLGKEGYILHIANSKIEIKGLTDAGIYYGIQTLKQLIAQNGIIPNVHIYDKPDISIRAWQDDISRGPIPTMDFLKKQIETMASFKLNYFTLYIEHVFKFKQHPGIAPEQGINSEQLRELEDFAATHFVTLIGSYQSFGHMAKTLSLPAYAHLAENEHIISPALDASYQFLEEVFSEIVPAFNGEFFNINCDETFGLGEGKSKIMVDSLGIAGVYSYHINQLDKILKKYNKKILMWGDIAAKYPEIVPSLPKDITVIPWAYHGAESFDELIKPIANQSLNFWIAPGVSCWSKIFPNLQTAKVNIFNFIRDGYKLNATGVLNTSWDDGGFNFFNNNWHGFAWGAENSWNAPTTEISIDERFQNFNHAFNQVGFGTSGDIADLFLKFSTLHQSEVKNELEQSRFFEPLFPIHLDYVKKGQLEENLKDIETITIIKSKLNVVRQNVTKNAEWLDYFEFALDQALFTLRKNIFRINIYNFINGDRQHTVELLKERNRTLICELEKLKKAFANLWKQENRLYWLNANMTRFDDLIKSMHQLGGHIIIEPINEMSEKGRAITIRSVFNEIPIQYELNGKNISTNAPVYRKPIYSKSDIMVTAKSQGDFEEEKIELIFHEALGSFYKLNSPYSTYHPSYNGGGEEALVDGQQGLADDFKSGKWQAYSGQDIDIELSFPQRKSLKTFSMGFLQNTASWIIFPRQVEIYIKNKKDEPYKLFKTIETKIPPEAEGSLKENYTATLDKIRPAFIRIISRNYGKLPVWHHAGSGYDAMLFADEIIIK